MMATLTYDIFLSHSPHDAGTASAVTRAFTEAGISVFAADAMRGNQILSDAILREMVEAQALVALVTPVSVNSINIGLEIGAAMSWHKPVFILTDGVPTASLPSILRNHPVFPVPELPRVVEELRKLMRPLSHEDQDALREVYARMQIATDALLTNPEALDRFTREFNRQRNTSYPGEKLTQELLRLRKRGDLPKIGRGRRAASA